MKWRGSSFQFATPSTFWTPALMVTQLWQDVSDSATIIVSSGSISQVSDKSGNNRHAVQSTPTNQPSLVTVSGLPVKRYDGVDDFMTINSAFFPSGVPSGISFIIAAIVQENSGGFGGVITTNPGAAENSGCGLLINSNRTYSVFVSASDVRTGASSTRTVITAVVTAGISTIFTLGTQQATGNVTNNVVNASTTVLGKYRIGDINFGGFDLNELVVAFDTSTLTRQRLEGYMAWKVGLQGLLPANHPHRLAPPSI